VLTQQAGWRSLYHLTGVLALVLVAVVRLGLRGEWAESRGEPFDSAGSLLYAAGLLSAMYGFSLLPSLTGGLLILAGAMAAAGFVAWERRAPHPVMPLELFFSNRVFAFSNLAALVNYAATFAVGFLLSLYLQYARGLSAQAAGLVLVTQPAVMTAVSPFAGRLSDRIDSRIVASLGMGVTAFGLAMLCALGPATSLAYPILALAVLGCGFGLFSSPNTNAVMASVERPLYGVASASLGTMRLTGQMLSMAIATSLLAIFVGSGALTMARSAPLVTVARVAFLLFAILCVAGTFASLARGRSGTKASP
jgi:Na+/melibiose symporter-like transporter